MSPPGTSAKAVPTAQEAYVTSALARLYPPPLRLQAGGRRQSSDTRAAFLMLPAWHPHIVVPAGHPRAAARAVHRSFTGPRSRTRVARWLLTLAMASGAADLLSAGRIAVRGPAGAASVDRLLAQTLGVDTVFITMPVGPARANRKPVLQVTDPEGNVLAFVKIGLDDLTRSLVRAEGRTLDRVAQAGLRRTRAPRVLAALEWSDLCLLVLEPLPVARPDLPDGRAEAALIETVREVGRLSTWRGGWSGNPFAAQLRAELQAVRDSDDGTLLGALDQLDDDAPAIDLGSWHGDLNPGNLAVLPDQVLVWDWERFDDSVPVGFDLLHHDLHQAITVKGVGAQAAAGRLLDKASDTLGKLGVDGIAAQATARLYLLTLAGRYLRDNQVGAGAPLGRVRDWIVPVLRARAGR
ncbi:MAG: hypothetical protein M3O55_00925 [Actinomycetota bacterium]|nr:hypothetical protein [Actinomycetota bacterium]